MKSQRAMYSIDWLQIFCSVPKACPPDWESRFSSQADEHGNHREYKIIPSAHFIKGYHWQREIMYRNYTIATIACQPVDERHREDGGAIKLANPVLYVADWHFILSDVLNVLGWTPLNITRVDLCCDFNFFLGGLAPQTFLRKYVTKDKASYLRKGSNKAAVYLIKDMRCTIFDSIRWGSRQSGVSVYMYNKSKELREVKDKPWIREAWKKAELSSTKDVWRVEISISSQGLGLKNLKNHLFHNLFVDELRGVDAVRDIFRVYAAKHFSFLHTDPKAKYKKDLKPVQLLDLTTSCTLKPVSLVENHDTGRMERIVSNKLLQLYDYVAVRDYTDKYAFLHALETTIEVYNAHHNIKAEVSDSLAAMENHLMLVICNTFQLPEKSSLLSRIRSARSDLSEWESLARQLAREVIGRQTCTKENPLNPERQFGTTPT